MQVPAAIRSPVDESAAHRSAFSNNRRRTVGG
jgi:hypothetical protein